jgi:hypothetical protein
LRRQFGSTSQVGTEFRTAFEQALMQVQQSWPHFVLVMRDEAVEFRCAAPAPVAERAEPAPAVPPPPQDEVEVDADADEEPSLLAELESELSFQTSPEPEFPDLPDQEPVPERPVAAPPAESPRQGSRQTISLRSHLTGLPQVVWLQRSNGRDNVVIEVTPGGRYDPETSTVIALEPVALQVSGGLYTRDFERVAAWAAANRDLIDDWWDSRVAEFDEVVSRVKKVPAPAWR